MPDEPDPTGQPQPLNLDQLPLEIRESTRAVLWKYEIREGNRTKVPYVPSDPSRRASVTDPSTWGTFSEARDAFEDGKAEGVGIVLGEGLVGVDLDHCRDPQTGAIEPRALVIIARLDSFTEVSPSGEGIHILLHGALPPGRRRQGNTEMYEAARYFTLTGAHLPATPATIEDRTAELATLHAELFSNTATNRQRPAGPNHRTVPPTLDDQRLIEIATGASNGAAFSQLYDGDTSSYQSRSEGDLALLNHLALYSGCDSAQMDRLYRQSGLMREKWDEPRGESTYGEQTIELAIEGCQDTCSPRADRGVSLEDFHAYRCWCEAA